MLNQKKGREFNNKKEVVSIMKEKRVVKVEKKKEKNCIGND